MKNRIFLLTALLLCASVIAIAVPHNNLQNRLMTYPAPEGTELSPDYSIEVNGMTVPIYPVKTQHHDKKYSIAYFDFEGEVTVKISSVKPLNNLKVLPDKYGITPTVNGNEAVFTINSHFNISFEPDGCNSPLLLFTNPIETDIPDINDPNVVYFGPGEHDPEGGLIKLSDNQTLYIAGGAVLNAGIEASGDNITIRGRGILDGSDWDHNAGPTDYMINARDCNNLVLKDIILQGSYYWTVVPQRCDRVLVHNLRLAGSRVGNDDGVNPCNSSNVTIRNCFFRTDDDSISPKGITRAGGEQNSKSVENILVENCTFWVDFANVFRIATESSCPALRNFTARNIDVIHFPDRDRVQIFWLHPTGEMAMENLVFENIRINGEIPYNLIKMTPAFQLTGTRPMIAPTPNNIAKGPGRRGMGSRGYGEFVVVPSNGPYIHNVVFRNISTYGKTVNPENKGGVIFLQGLDDNHNVSEVTFDNVTYYGSPIKATYPKIKILNNVEGVKYIQ